MNRNYIIIIASAALMLLMVYYTNRSANQYKVPFYQYNTSTSKIEKYNQPFRELQKIDFFSAIDQNGKEYSSDSLEDKIYVVDYFFVTCPGICKEMGVEMKKLYDLYINDHDIVLLSFTSKPEEDSIPVLSDYGAKMGIKDASKWKLLNADKKVLFELAKNEFGILNEDDTEGEFVHTEKFALIDKNGYIRGYYDGTSPEEVNNLVKDIKLIKAEKK